MKICRVQKEEEAHGDVSMRPERSGEEGSLCIYFVPCTVFRSFNPNQRSPVRNDESLNRFHLLCAVSKKRKTNDVHRPPEKGLTEPRYLLRYRHYVHTKDGVFHCRGSSTADSRPSSVLWLRG
jgi:hypothetical protein